MPGTLVAQFPLLDGVPAKGTVEIEPVDAATLKPIPEIVDADGNRVFSGRITPPLNDSGGLEVELPAADDDVNPQGFAYLVTPLLEHINLDPVLLVILKNQTLPFAQAVTPPAVAPEYAQLVGQAAYYAQLAQQGALPQLWVRPETDPPPDGWQGVWFVLNDQTGAVTAIRIPDA